VGVGCTEVIVFVAHIGLIFNGEVF